MTSEELKQKLEARAPMLTWNIVGNDVQGWAIYARVFFGGLELTMMTQFPGLASYYQIKDDDLVEEIFEACAHQFARGLIEIKPREVRERRGDLAEIYRIVEGIKREMEAQRYAQRVPRMQLSCKLSELPPNDSPIWKTYRPLSEGVKVG